MGVISSSVKSVVRQNKGCQTAILIFEAVIAIVVLFCFFIKEQIAKLQRDDWSSIVILIGFCGLLILAAWVYSNKIIEKERNTLKVIKIDLKTTKPKSNWISKKSKLSLFLYKKRIRHRKKMLSIRSLKKAYPKGSRIELVFMSDKDAPPVGTQGTIIGIDRNCSIMVNWDNGSKLSIVNQVDKIKRI